MPLVPGLEINKITLYITEHSLREILAGLDEHKEEHPESTAVYAESEYEPVRLLISIETEPNTQESFGYKIK